MPPSHACDACHAATPESVLDVSLNDVDIAAHWQEPGRIPNAVAGSVDTQQQSPPSPSKLGPAVILEAGDRGCAPIFSSFHHDPGHIQANLVAEANAILSPGSVVELAYECIDHFFQYLFPNTPIAHEPTLRDAATLLTLEGHSTLTNLPSCSDSQQQVACLRRFTLITAFCAFVTAIMPEIKSTQISSLSKLFLLVSRATLQLYEEYDLQYPDSTSLAIRMWYSSAMQNRTGRVGTSYHYHAEAAYIALRLRLYNENAVQRKSKVETRLLRTMFWLLFLADKTAYTLETRPPILNEISFTGDFNLLENSDREDPMLDQSKMVNQCSLESRIFIGFHLKRRIWSAAAEMISNIRAFSLQKKQRLIQLPEEEVALAHLTEAYLLFTGITDQLPAWLRQPGSVEDVADEEVAAYHSSCFWTQRSNIMTAFHSIMGLNSTPLSWAMRKIEIAQEFLHELQIVPFICFKVQGEPAVERIRRVGSTLLELVHNAKNDTVQDVARSQFDQLLEFLTKLDSKASDELAGVPM
ncbi:Transcription factor [Penicillium occitanis (nom. inval.)]|nr:Transcription factor [Penicillium occitanis (nom. inval.)]PCH04456.1 hypothetical protein PENOC_033390 [Penicillium occitanis (nom. inval.)]